MKKYPLNPVAYSTRFRDMIDDLAERYGDAPAISWFSRKQEETVVSYRQLCEDVKYLQEALISLGLAGKHIAIVGENCYEWLLVYFAANYCGSTAICVDVEQSDETIRYMLAAADTDAVFLSPAYTDVCSGFADTQIPQFLLYGKNSTYPLVRHLIETGAKIWLDGNACTTVDAAVTPENIASIVFTSGTTSHAKPVMLSQQAILTNASDALANVRIGQRTFTSLPFYHTYGLTCSVLSMLIPGSHLHINGNLRTVMRDLHLSKANTLLTVPLMLEMIHSRIWQSAEESGKDESLKKLFRITRILRSIGIRRPGKILDGIREKSLGSIDLIICGGAHMNPEIMDQFQCMGVTVLQGYGITECGPLVSVNRNEANKLDSVGLVTANCQVKLDNGEILVRGKNLMTGYYNHPEMTEESMRDGWFCTGDLGELDKDGFLYITGRKKNLIVFKNGKKLSPEKLEEKIKQVPIVQDVLVYGAVNGLSSDDVQVAASIYPRADKVSGMTSYEILESLQKEIDEINRDLPMYQQIQMINIRDQAFSKTALQKIKRHLV
jgi:long-chain acyl-CoA synthetase